ncbi:MAG: hypothetical protein M5U28_16855 [Sandaracinaceae bacterium]|nr:hypothetical protein [Sandaracinaceae bacterium]
MELPPASLWLEYVLWQTLGPAFGRELADAAERASACELSARLREAFDAAADAAGLAGFAIDDVAELAELAAPYLPPTLRGGCRHVEVGLAVRARLERRAHVVLSVRSFGCVPSAGITDGILPAALGDELPFLALEVCGDGEAAREPALAAGGGGARRGRGGAARRLPRARRRRGAGALARARSAPRLAGPARLRVHARVRSRGGAMLRLQRVASAILSLALACGCAEEPERGTLEVGYRALRIGLPLFGRS